VESKVPLTDANQKKEVAKVGDKPLEQGQDAADKARHALSLEATAKPGDKVVAKPEGAVGGSAAAYSDFLNASFDKASTTIRQTMAMLPSLSIEGAAGKKIDQKHTTTDSLDFSGFINAKFNEKEKACAPATASDLGGFSFITPEKKVEEIKGDHILTQAAAHLADSDWKKVMQAYDKATGTADAQNIADGAIHRDQSGKIDVIRQGDKTITSTADNGHMISSDAGDTVKNDANGDVEFHMQDGKFVGQLESGNRVVVEKDGKGNERLYLVDKSGKGISEVFEGESGEFKVIGKFENGNIVTSNSTVEQAGGIHKLAEQMAAKARETKTNQVLKFSDSIMAVTPNGRVIAAKKDHTTLVSISEGRYLVRNADKSWTIHEKGKAPVQLAAEDVRAILAAKEPEEEELIQALRAVINFGDTKTLSNTEGTSTIAISGDRMSGRMNEVKSTTDESGKTVVTGLLNGESQRIDTSAKTVEVAHADGKVDRVAVGPKGFKFTGKNYKYDSGKVTTSSGDVVTSNGVQMANGTQIHRDGSVDFTDGSRIKADGTVGESLIYSKKESERTTTQTADSKAASVAGYAMGKAGEIRGRAASGHATASDIASLEAAFAGLCEAVTALSGNCDPSTQFKLYTAKSSVSESISVGKAHLNDKPVGIAA